MSLQISMDNKFRQAEKAIYQTIFTVIRKRKFHGNNRKKNSAYNINF